jgi:Domain of unknown function (DUF4349)
MPATDTDFEREFADLVAELRSVPADAPDSLRARVRALGEPEAPPTLRDRLATIRWRRAVLVAAPVCAALLVSVAVVRGVLSSGSEQRATLTRESGALTTARENPRAPAHGARSALPVFGAATTDAQRGIAGGGGRPVDYDASLRVRVRDADALSYRTAEAMRIARSLGGYVDSVQQTTTRGKPGEADLVLRVPVARVEQALIRLSALGTVLEQHLSIVDLQQTLDRQRRRISNLRVEIARLNEALRNQSLAADVRIRLQLRLAEARRELSRLTVQHRATRREAALSQISLTLTTERAAAAVPKDHQGRLERAARDAASFLAAAGAVLLFLLIVVSPLLVLAAVWFYGQRAYRRREERRLLAAAPE